MSLTTKCDDLLQLTPTQQVAIDHLLAGKNDRETAELVAVHRTTVSRWRLYHPGFRSELHNRRVELYAAGAERLRAMIPSALDAIQAELEGDNRLAAASLILKMTGLEGWRITGATTTAESDVERQIQAEVRKIERDRAFSGDWHSNGATSDEKKAEKAVISRLRKELATPTKPK